MKSLRVISLTVSVMLATFTSCDNRPAAKFRPGDKIRVKATHEEGTVCLRTRFFRQDQYFVTLSGGIDTFRPIGERERDAAWAAKYGHAWDYVTRSSHEEGPFYDSELESGRE